MYNFFVMGSCRVHEVPYHIFARGSKSNVPIGYTHGINEHIQLIKFLRGEVEIPSHLRKYIYTFWGGAQEKRDIQEIVIENQILLKSADTVLIEISSLKEYIYKNIYFQQSRYVDSEKWGIQRPPLELSSKVVQNRQDKIEFFTAMDQLVNVLDNKKLIFTGHVGMAKLGKFMKDRFLLNSFLEEYCLREGHTFYNLSGIADKVYPLFMKSDSVHFTFLGNLIAAKNIGRAIKIVNEL